MKFLYGNDGETSGDNLTRNQIVLSTLLAWLLQLFWFQTTNHMQTNCFAFLSWNLRAQGSHSLP